LNILLFNTYANFGGAARACYRLHNGFRREGHASTLLARHHTGPALEGVELYDGCRRSKRAKHDSTLARLRCAALVAPDSTYFSPPAPAWCSSPTGYLEQADAINIHWIADYLSTRDLRKLFNSGKPVVWTLHDARAFTGGCHYTGECFQFQWNCSSCPQLHPPFRPLADAGLEVQRNLFKVVKMPTFVTPSAWLGRLAASSPLLAHARIEVIPNSLDLTTFRPKSADATRSQMGWKKEAVVVLLGAHSIRDKRKGVDLVLDAIEQCVQDQNIDRMIQAGDLVFACFGEAQDMATRKGLPIQMLGAVEGEKNAASVYQVADLFICASREDNLPNTVMEAMACGLAVVGTRIGGIPEMIDDEKTGRLVPVGDATSLAAALMDLIRNKNKVRAMGVLARRKCEELYSSSRQVDAYIRLFENLRDQGPTKTPQAGFRNKLRSALAGRRAAKALAGV
jgi:glycosyltransferase involved in cell wall biosynthesis